MSNENDEEGWMRIEKGRGNRGGMKNACNKLGMQDKNGGGLRRMEEVGEGLRRTAEVGEGYRRPERNGGCRRGTEEA